MMANCMLGYLILSVFVLRCVELKECGNKTLGLRDDDGLPYYYFQGTSYSAESTNKDINKNTPKGATWCPETNKVKDSFLEVDLGKQYSLRGVSTQGDKNGFTTSYKIKLSSDRIQWKFYQNNGTDMVFEGNKDSTTIVTHPLNSAEKARFVRFYPIAFDTNACIRVELYGQEIVKKKCEKTAIDANAPDVVVTSFPKIPPSKNLTILNGTELWCWSSNSPEPYLKVDFGAYSIICALQVSFNGMVEISYGHKSLNKSQKINGSQLYVPEEKILTTFLQLKPIGNSSCISVKIFGYLNEELVNEDIGFQYGQSAIFFNESFATSSDQFDTDNDITNPHNGRLYKPDIFWCPSFAYRPSYLELILVKKYYIFAVSVQGKTLSTGDFTKKFTISYSDDYANWKEYNTKFTANFNNHIQKHFFGKPIEGRIVRIKFLKGTLRTKPCLKVEVHGMMVEELSGYCRKPHPLGLGRQQEKIPDESIKVSSQLGSQENRFGRLRYKEKCWCAMGKSNQMTSVDLGQLVSISGVATQGCDPGKVTKYKIRYSYDGQIWYGYPSNTSLMTFPGNSPSRDVNTIFANWLNDSIIARHIQIEIQDYYNDRCLRLEVYGCRNDVGMPVIEPKSDSKSLNRIINTTITLDCHICGQAGMIVTWKRDGQPLQGSSFETTETEYPQDLLISAEAKTQINIIYKNDRDIYDNFHCTESRTNSRRLLCRSIYSCSASYPGANTSSQGDIPVTITPNIVLPDVPEKPSISNIKSRSAVITWKAADDYLESRLERYVIHVSNENYTMKINVISRIDEKNLTYHLQNLTEYTSYHVSIAAESAIAISNFTEEVTFSTFYGPYLFLKEQSLKIVKVNEKNITIPCTERSYPTPYVIWKKNGTEIQSRENSTVPSNDSVYQIITQSGWDNKSNVYLEVTSTLFLRPNGIKYDDHGNYTCEVLNINESSTPLSKTVEIQFPPRITKGPNDTIINEGENVTLTCDAEGPPKPTFTWSNVSERVTIEGIISKNNKLELRNVRSAGNYKFIVTCKASNKGGNSRANATIEILVKPRIINLTRSQTALLYHDVRLTCEILANPPAQIWWTKDGNKSHLSNVQFENDNETLVITKAVLDNIGKYSCHASHNLYLTNASLTLNLKAHPETYIVGGEIRKLRQGQKNSSIVCRGYGYPNPRATWKINNMTIPEDSNSSIGSGIYQRRLTNDLVLQNVTSTLYFNQNGSTFDDFGNYTCEVFIKPAPDTDSETVEVIFYPVVLTEPSDKTILQGHDVRFDCEVNGRPKPSPLWLFNNQSVSTNHSKLSNGSLFLYSVQNNDLYEGSYSCFAENEAGRSEKSTSYLTVHVSPQVEVNTSSAIYLNSTDEKGIIRCRGKGYPLPVVSWFRDGKKIDTNSSSDVYQVFGTTTPARFLGWISTILYVHPDPTHRQFGNYSCNATKLKDNEDDLKVVEIVLIPTVSITKVPNTSTVLQGTNVTFTSTADGAPKPTITWSRVNGIISTTNSSIITSEGKSVLILTNVTNEEEGVYECTAHNRGKPVKKQVSLIVHVKPRILQNLENDDVQNGTSYKLNCSAYGDPALTYSWTINGNQNIPNAIPINGNKTLHINPVTIENEGTYKCVVTNVEGNASTTANITVFARPKIINSPVDQTRNETDSVKFSCGGNGIPTPDIIWTKDVGHEIKNSSKYDIENVHGSYNFQTSYLTINDLKYADRGNYSCTLRNRKDMDVETAVLVVQVHPVARIDPNSVSVNITKSVTFTCKVYCFPKPQVSWLKNRQEIGNNSHYNTSSFYGNDSNLTWYNDLQIEKVERDDTANYSCFLRNAAGTDIDDVSLVVLERPDSLNVSTKNVTSRSVVVEWKANFDGNTDILHYTLKYFINGSESSTTKQKPLSSNVTSYRVTSLKPYSAYIFEMTATNEIGVSDISSKSIHTLQDMRGTEQNRRRIPMAERLGTFMASWKTLSYDEKQKLLKNFKSQLHYTAIDKGKPKVLLGEKSDHRGVEANKANPQDIKHGVKLYSYYSYLYYYPTIRWDLDQFPDTNDYWVGIFKKDEEDDKYITWTAIGKAHGSYRCGKLKTVLGSDSKDRNEQYELRIFDGDRRLNAKTNILSGNIIHTGVDPTPNTLLSTDVDTQSKQVDAETREFINTIKTSAIFKTAESNSEIFLLETWNIFTNQQKQLIYPILEQDSLPDKIKKSDPKAFDVPEPKIRFPNLGKPRTFVPDAAASNIVLTIVIDHSYTYIYPAVNVEETAGSDNAFMGMYRVGSDVLYNPKEYIDNDWQYVGPGEVGVTELNYIEEVKEGSINNQYVGAIFDYNSDTSSYHQIGLAATTIEAVISATPAIPPPDFSPDFDKVEALRYAKLSELAYQPYDVVKTKVGEFGLVAEMEIFDKGTHTTGFIASDDNTVVVAFRGTDRQNWLTDVWFRLAKIDANVDKYRAHEGFVSALNSVYTSIEATLRPVIGTKKLFITGHSLGGALATLLGFRISYVHPNSQPIQYVYGCPPVGDIDLANYFAGMNSNTITIDGDFVSSGRLLLLGRFVNLYKPVKVMYLPETGGHSIAGYINQLENL